MYALRQGVCRARRRQLHSLSAMGKSVAFWIYRAREKQEIIMTDKDFRDLVAAMRRAQRIYFKERSGHTLRQAKTLECEVDKVLKEWPEDKTANRQCGLL